MIKPSSASKASAEKSRFERTTEKKKKMLKKKKKVDVSGWGTQNASSARRGNMETLKKHAYILYSNDECLERHSIPY